MKEVFIDIRKENRWIKDRFKNKDYVSIKDLMGEIEDLIFKIENLEEEKEDLIAQIHNECEEPDWYQEWADHQLEIE